ncbi:MAG: hypothetical protein AVDCRST_MAG15-1308, partial [uncultured Rubellimicrobium sp.]
EQPPPHGPPGPRDHHGGPRRPPRRQGHHARPRCRQRTRHGPKHRGHARHRHGPPRSPPRPAGGYASQRYRRRLRQRRGYRADPPRRPADAGAPALRMLPARPGRGCDLDPAGRFAQAHPRRRRRRRRRRGGASGRRPRDGAPRLRGRLSARRSWRPRPGRGAAPRGGGLRPRPLHPLRGRAQARSRRRYRPSGAGLARGAAVPAPTRDRPSGLPGRGDPAGIAPLPGM